MALVSTPEHPLINPVALERRVVPEEAALKERVVPNVVFRKKEQSEDAQIRELKREVKILHGQVRAGKH